MDHKLFPKSAKAAWDAETATEQANREHVAAARKRFEEAKKRGQIGKKPKKIKKK